MINLNIEQLLAGIVASPTIPNSIKALHVRRVELLADSLAEVVQTAYPTLKQTGPTKRDGNHVLTGFEPKPFARVPEFLR